MKKVICTICLIVILLITGCATIREQLTAAGYNSNYIDGYIDGHPSGYVAAGHPWYSFQKNTYRYEDDSQYRQGWNDGFATSKGRYDMVGRALGGR